MTSATATAPAAPPVKGAPAAPSEPPQRLTPMQQLGRFTERFGHMMSRIVLTLLYALLVAPAGIVLALLGDPLRIRRWSGSSWSPWREQNDTLELARRQD